MLHILEKTDVIDIEAKEALSYFTNDVIATSVYGLKINSMENPDCEFYKMGKKTSDFSGLQLLKVFGHALMPKVMKVSNVGFSDVIRGVTSLLDYVHCKCELSTVTYENIITYLCGICSFWIFQ